MKYAHTELKHHYKSITALLYLLIVCFAVYVLIGSLGGISVNRYTQNAYQVAINKEKTNPTGGGQVAGVATENATEQSGYITEPSVLQLPR